MWQTRPISPTCEKLVRHRKIGHLGYSHCGEACDFAYPAHPNGWMALCRAHAKHFPPNQVATIEFLIYSGNTFENETASFNGPAAR